MAKKIGLDWESVRKLVDVQKQSNKTLPELAQAVQQHLHKETYTREVVAKELDLSVSSHDLGRFFRFLYPDRD